MLIRKKYIPEFIVFVILLVLVVFHLPDLVLADTDIKITICDPDHLGQKELQEGNTINTVLSAPSVSYGENKILGTVQITGKPGIKIPVPEKQKVMVILPPGISYMQVPDASSYNKYVEWPAQLDGNKNQICDYDDKPGIKFVAASPNSITVEVNHIDPGGNNMVINFVFNQDNYSKVRVAPFIEVADKYSQDTEGEISRLEFFTLFADLTWRFSASPVKLGDSSILPQDLYTDVNGSEAGIYKLIPLIENGFIKGYEGRVFKPDQSVSRAEAVSVAGMVFGPAKSASALFKDELPAWAQDGIYAAYNAGIVQGYPDGTFRPDNPLTRNEAIIILQNCLASYSKQ